MSFRLIAAAPAIRSILVRQNTVYSHQSVRRFAQDSGVGRTHGKKSSDLPWIIGAVAFTVPTSLYLLSGSSKPAHSSTAHGHASKEESSSQGTSETASDATSDQAHEATSKVRDKASELYDEVKNKAEISTAEVAETAAAVKEKSSEELEYLIDEVKTKVGEYTGSEESSDQDVEPKEEVVEKPLDVSEPNPEMKKPTSTNTQKGKQEGISNTDTRNPVLGRERGQAISKKGEEVQQSVKLKETVDQTK